MLKELISIIKGDSPLKEISVSFREMLSIAQEMTLEASEIYWRTTPSMERVRSLYERDIRVNKLERTIRKRIATHLTINANYDVPYSLLLMSLVKDVERLGDYAKNLAETCELTDAPIPDDELTVELRDIRDKVETLAREASRVFAESDRERATELTVGGRVVAKRCDELVRQIARSEYSPALTVKLTLGTRYYKRINSHVLNVLSSVIMPLHKLDYYDEDLLHQANESAV